MSSSTPKVHYITLGCKVNQAESEALAAFAHANAVLSGHRLHNDICIINTCSVTGKAAMQSRQAIRKAVRMNPNATIIVTGCYAQSDPEAVAAIDGVDFVIGQKDKNRIFEIVSNSLPAARPRVLWENSRKDRHFKQMPAPATGSRTRPFLKIQDGCNAFCTYCIVPYTRGASRSLPADRVLEEYYQLVAAGAQEIVLTGIHLGRYGLDLSPQSSLVDLLRAFEQAEGNPRMRLSSLEPTEISEEMLDVISASNQICHHFHVPLQSGDRDVLKRMGRPYTPETFDRVIRMIHSRFPDAAIGADVLIGFPGETESAFLNTLNLLQSLPITYLHVFPFSPRPPAPAAAYPNQVPSPVAKKRCRIIQDLGKLKKVEFYARMAEKELDVIIEKRLSGRMLKCISSNYIPVLCDDPGDVSPNSRHRCRIIGIPDDQALIGAICRHGSPFIRPESIAVPF